MTKKELFKEINALCDYMVEKYRINSGGCCYVAAVLAEYLTKCDIDYQVVYYNSWWDGCHYYIKVSDRNLNRDGCNWRYTEILAHEDYREIYQWYYDGDWNNRYDKRYNGIVKISLKRIFDKYRNSKGVKNGQKKRNREIKQMLSGQ